MDIWGWGFTICVVILILGVVLNAITPNIKLEDNTFSKPDDCKTFHYDFPEIPNGYYYHEMVGMYYRGITSKDFGVYDGYAIPEEDNKYDPYAVAIYRKADNKHVGYTPSGNKDLFKTLQYRGGKANAIFKIQGNRQHIYGAVYIEENYKFFRVGNTKNPYLSKTTKSFILWTAPCPIL